MPSAGSGPERGGSGVGWLDMAGHHSRCVRRHRPCIGRPRPAPSTEAVAFSDCRTRLSSGEHWSSTEVSPRSHLEETPMSGQPGEKAEAHATHPMTGAEYLESLR